eukprot:gene20891-22942_t
MVQAERSAITRQCEVMANVTGYKRKKKDLNRTHGVADEKAVVDIMQTVESMINPFENFDGSLLHLSSGIVANSNITSHMKDMHERRENAAMNFMRQQIMCENPNICTPIKKTNLRTFSSLTKTIKSKNKKGDIVALKNSKVLFARMILIATRRHLDMKEVLRYSLRPYPLSLATNEGGLVKTVKSKLLAAIEAEVPDCHEADVVGGKAYVIDGMAVLQMLPSTSNTFNEFAENLLRKIIQIAASSNAGRVDFVCDKYPAQSIKYLEKERRACGGSQIIRIYSGQQRVPRQWKKFLSSGENKEELVKFIFHAWQNVDPILFRNIQVFLAHESQCHQLIATSNGIVPDTDVFLIAVNANMHVQANLFFETGVRRSRRIISLQKVKQSIGDQWCSSLIGLHAFTANLSKFVCHLYGFEDCTDVNDVHYQLFKKGKYDEELLRPKNDSLEPHMKRANYQCYIWRHAEQAQMNLPRFSQYGWGLDDGNMSCHWRNLPPAPDSILEFISCKCTKGCENNRCSCLKAELPCTDICKCNGCKNNKPIEDKAGDSDAYDIDGSSSSSDDSEDE